MICSSSNRFFFMISTSRGGHHELYSGIPRRRKVTAPVAGTSTIWGFEIGSNDYSCGHACNISRGIRTHSHCSTDQRSDLSDRCIRCCGLENSTKSRDHAFGVVLFLVSLPAVGHQRRSVGLSVEEAWSKDN